MKRIYRIGHISDTHISRQFYREHIKSLKLLLKEMLKDKIDHIVVSGDIVSTGDEDDFYLAREIFFSFGLLSSDRLTVVPGNHDIFGGPHRAVDILSFPQHIRSVDYNHHMTLFQNAFAETFSNIYRLSPVSIFPFVKILGDFAIVGINSIPPWSLRKNILGTNGNIDDEQFKALERLKDNGLIAERTVVAVLHHQFNDIKSSDIDGGGLWTSIEAKTMRMRKRRKTLRLFESIGVKYVLHGHIHRNELFEKQNIVFVNGAGAVCDDPVRFLKYNVLEKNKDFCSVKIYQLPIPYQVSTVMQALHRNHKPLHMPVLSLTTLDK